MQVQPVSQLDPSTVVSIERVVDDKMQNRECFFALDVSNQVKFLGYNTVPPSNFGSHRLMRPVIEDTCRAFSKVHGYSWALLDVAGGNEQSYLYFPDGTNTATIQSHVNRRVSPLMPVEVFAAQRSQQGSGVQSQAVQTQTASQSQNGVTQSVTQTQSVTPGTFPDNIPDPYSAALTMPLKPTLPDKPGVVRALGQHIIKMLGGGSST